MRTGSKKVTSEAKDIGGVEDRRWLAAILAGYLVLALLDNAVTEVGESPDEGPHAEYVRYLVEKQRFPVFGEPGITYEAHQPPLY